MQRNTTAPNAIKGTRATLHLNGTPVGSIRVQGWDTSWTWGEFEPHASFAKFATLFGRWSLLMHEDEELPLNSVAAQVLSEAEREMDALRARVHFPDDDSWHKVVQVNIDGTLIEWKEA